MADACAAISPDRRQEYLATALAVVARARAFILDHWERGFSARQKPDHSYVTEVDLGAEELIRAGLREAFPQHGIIGEEFPSVNPEADFQWIVDPIDGTLSFTRGVPLFGTILALHYQGSPLIGVIDHPALGQCYTAALGQGAFCNGRRLRLGDGPRRPVEEEIIAISDRAQFLRSNREQAFDALLRRHQLVRGYTDCFGHSMAVRGAVGAMVDFGLHLWDLAATQLLIEEAGGKYVCAQIVEQDKEGFVYGIICGRPAVVDWLLSIFEPHF